MWMISFSQIHALEIFLVNSDHDEVWIQQIKYWQKSKLRLVEISVQFHFGAGLQCNKMIWNENSFYRSPIKLYWISLLICRTNWIMIKFANTLWIQNPPFPLSSYFFKTVPWSADRGESISLSPEDNNKDGWVEPLVGSSCTGWGYEVGSSFRGGQCMLFIDWEESIEGYGTSADWGFMVEYRRTGSALMNRVIGARWSCLCLLPLYLPPYPHVEPNLTTGSLLSHQSKLPSLVPCSPLIGWHRPSWIPIGCSPHVGSVWWLRAYLCEDWLQQMARPERCPECAGKMGKCMVGCMALNKSTKM